MAKDMRITDGSELRITENSHMILDDGSQVLSKGREAEPLFIGQVQNIAPVAAHIKEVNHIDPISIEALFVKVCGDGLTPKALYWLDRLGCVRQVLQETHSFIDRGDIFINGSHVLTGKFPQSTPYPGFGVLLDKRDWTISWSRTPWRTAPRSDRAVK